MNFSFLLLRRVIIPFECRGEEPQARKIVFVYENEHLPAGSHKAMHQVENGGFRYHEYPDKHIEAMKT